MLSEHVELIKKASERFGMENCLIDYDSRSGIGGHYMGVVTPVAVRDRDGDKGISFILKTAQTSDETRKSRAVIPAFETEFEFYNNVLPGLLAFQESHSLSTPFEGIPKYYGGLSLNKKEAILMENLIYNGYKLCKNREPMDFDHMALVIKEYAKFHAISLAFRYLHPDRFEDLTKNIKHNFLEQREAERPEHFRNLIETILDMGSKAVRGNRKAETAYKEFEKGYPVLRKRDKETPEKDIVVVSHGDCHQNNILFKYDPQKVCFIDWQLSATESPIHDLSFVLGVCASKEVLQRSEELFQTYRDVISQNLREYGCDPEKVFSASMFREHWKKHLFHGLYRAQTNLKLTLMSEEELAALGESTSILDALKVDFAVDSKFAQRMKDLYEIVGEKWL